MDEAAESTRTLTVIETCYQLRVDSSLARNIRVLMVRCDHNPDIPRSQARLLIGQFSYAATDQYYEPTRYQDHFIIDGFYILESRRHTYIAFPPTGRDEPELIHSLSCLATSQNQSPGV